MSAKRERDTSGLIMAAVFILIGAAFINDSRNLVDPDSYVFPVTICVVMIALSIGFITFNLIRPQADPDAGGLKGSTVRRVGLVALMLLSAFAMPFVGFLPAGIGVFAALMVVAMFEPWTWKRLAVYSVVCVAIVIGFYVVFDVMFLVPLPEIPFLS